MAIIYSAIVPHSPVLIPSIGKKNTDRLKLTLAAYRKIEEDLYSAQPDTILIISPHGPIQPTAFTLNISPEYHGKFEDFGDFSTTVNLNGDIGLACRIREKMETSVPLQTTTEENLDYGSAVPLFLLARQMPKVKIIPLHYSGLDLEAHYHFGQLLKKELLASQNRVAVIASGDLSHRLDKKSPAGYSPKGKKFDKKVTDCLQNKKIPDLLATDPELMAAAGECGLRSIIILLGILDGINCRPRLLSYESPFGIGYLVMSFECY